MQPDPGDPRIPGMTDQAPHFRIRHDEWDDHVHAQIWSTEQGGPDATHGHNGSLVFRPAEFATFRRIVDAGQAAVSPDAPLVEWVTGSGVHRPVPVHWPTQPEPGDPALDLP